MNFYKCQETTSNFKHACIIYSQHVYPLKNTWFIVVGTLNEMCKWLNENTVTVHNDRSMYTKAYEIMIVITSYPKTTFNF